MEDFELPISFAGTQKATIHLEDVRDDAHPFECTAAGCPDDTPAAYLIHIDGSSDSGDAVCEEHANPEGVTTCWGVNHIRRMSRRSKQSRKVK